MANPGQDTVEVEARLRFDEAALARYLISQGLPGVDGGPLKVKKFGYGQSNPTYCLDTHGGQRYVLRKQPPGKFIRGAHAVDREYRVMKALGQVGYEVPVVHALCEDPKVIGTSFYVMSFVKGHIPDNGLLKLPKDRRRSAMEAIVQSLARLHSYDPNTLGLLSGKPYGKVGGFYERQIRTMKRTSEAQVSGSDGHIPPMQRINDLIQLFEANMPPDRSCVIHGDWKPDNLILSPDGQPKVLAVVDWELSTIGHPMSDLANLCLPYHLGGLGRLVGYPALGSEEDGSAIEEEEVLRAYCAAAGVHYPIDHWSFYVAFACFRLAVIIQGVAMRVAKGSSSAAHGDVQSQISAFNAMCSLGCDIMTKAFGPGSSRL